MAARIILVVSLAILAVIPGGCGEANCPFVCFCFPNLDEDSATLTVDCRNQDLKEIPLNLPNNTSHLDVSNNQIQFIRIGDLSGLGSLTYLQLQNNELTAIQPGAFREVPNLERLTLFNNMIRELREGTFEGLTRLQSLIAYNIQLESYEVGVFDELRSIIEIDLSFNNLETIPTNSFTALTRLTRLLLNDNFIQEIEMGAIQNLQFLQYLNLANNQLRSITPMAFIDLPFLRTLSLQGNPLECGCAAIWLFDFLTAQSLQGPTCEEPPSLAGRNLLDLELEEFCALPTAVIEEPNAVLAEGNSLQLTCSTTGAPPPAVIWSRNGMAFDPMNPIVPMDPRIIISGGSLLITNVSVQDTGTYYCTATSTTGTVATSTMVTVLDVDLESMVDPFIGLLRQTAELNCSTSLPPGVPVQWEIDSMLLPSSDKYIITPSGSLLVMDLQLSDMTNYTCRVNGLNLTRELILQAEPQIVDFPEGPCETPDIIETTTERPVILTCSAFGIPAPTVQWLFQGMIEASAVTMTGGTTTAQLIRSPALEEHSGNYTCLASNALGSVSRTVQLELQILVVVNETATTSRMFLEGATIVLPCSVQNRNIEGATVTWMRMDGIPLDEKIVITSDFTLIIPNATQPDDIGVYMCTVIVNGFSTFISFGVIIFSSPMIDQRCDIPTTSQVTGDTVCLLCNASGNPFPAITWDRDGVPVEASDRVQFRDDDTKLQIEGLVVEDAGLYTCTATADDDLLPDEMLLDLGNDTGSQLLIVQPPSVRPFFRHMPDDIVQVTEGDVIQVLCSGGGNPQPTLTWWRRLGPGNATQLMPDLRTIISDQALVILHAEVEDDGVYYCNLSSPLMERISSDVIIRVWVLPTIPPLANEIIKLEGSSNVILPCNGTGDPSPVAIWMRGSEIVPIPSERYQQEPAGHLVISSVMADDAGVYSCRVANAAGDVFHQVNLIVRTLANVQVEPALVRANVGCQVSFFCSDGGSIPEEFAWMFDGETLESGGNVLVRPTGELVLSDLMVADSGNYTCAIWSPLGAAEAFTTLIVEDPLFASGADVSPPFISSPTPGLQQVPEGQTAQFVCLASGFPEPTFEWLRNGEPLPNLPRIVVEGGLLTIENLRTTDSATYTCNAANVFETVMMAFDLTVSVFPQFWIRPAPTEVIEHEVIMLECKAVGPPTPTINWVHEEVGEIIPGSRVIINNTVDTGLNSKTSVLRIFNSTLADSGTYTCVARNSAGMTQYGVPVVVSRFQSAPNVTVLPGSVTLISGSSLILDCETTGIPAPETIWLKDGVPLPMNQSSCSETLFDCVDDRSVIIISADVEDSGRYTCIAENEAGREAYEVFVTVTTAETLPFFTILPSPVWVEIGSDIAIDCQAEGTPPPNIIWLVGFEPVNESDWIMVLDNGTLVILDAQEEDAGLYTCRATSEGGINQVIISVDVGNITNVTRPDLIRVPVGELRVEPHETVELECAADGHPQPTIIWLRDGEKIVDQFSHIMQADNGSLVLENVTQSDNGTYICRAVNVAGSAEVHVRLVVEAEGAIGVGRAPQFTVLPEDMGILVGSEVRVDCQAEGSPDPYISWTHRSSLRPLYEDELVSVATNGSLLFYSAQMSHAGSYTCRASNIRGVVRKDIILEVWSKKEPPYFLEWPQSSRVVVGSPLLLRCLAASTMDTPTIQWTFNGQQLVLRPGGRKEILINGTLYIEPSLLDDSGNYTCIASNQCGSTNATALVTILRLPVDISHTAVVRSGYQMSCSSEQVGSVVGEGGGMVEWKKEGEILAGSGRVLVFQGLLIFLGVRLEDEGEYMCSTTTDRFNHFLEVQVPPSIQVSPLVQARSGDTAALHCLAGGKPTPLVTWQRYDLILERDDKFSILSNGTLLLYRSTVNDAGMYLCEASNEVGSVERSIFLVVTELDI